MTDQPFIPRRQPGDYVTRPDLAKDISDDTALPFDPTELDPTRQEFADDADINKILARFGIQTPSRQVIFGETDTDIDLQAALAAVDMAETAWIGLPRALKAKFPDMRSLLNAIAAGNVRINMTREEAPPPPTPVPPSPGVT